LPTPGPAGGASDSRRQEVLNVLLAQLLQERGLVSAPEQILHPPGIGAARMPDVLVEYQGLRLMIEGEIASTPQAAEAAAAKALGRVEQGIAHLGAAVVYPASLKFTEFSSLKRALSEARLSFAIVNEPQTQVLLIPPDQGVTAGFRDGTVDDFVETLHRAYDQLVRDEVLERAVSVLETGIEQFRLSARQQPGSLERLGIVLGAVEVGRARVERAGVAARRPRAVVRKPQTRARRRVVRRKKS
jgi:hypothetical protein